MSVTLRTGGQYRCAVALCSQKQGRYKLSSSVNTQRIEHKRFSSTGGGSACVYKLYMEFVLLFIGGGRRDNVLFIIYNL